MRVQAAFWCWGLLLQARALHVGPKEPNVLNAECHLGSIPKFVLNLRRRSDRLLQLRDTFSDTAPWLLDGLCRVVAPDANNLGEMSAKLVDPSRWLMSKIRTEHREPTMGGVHLYLTTGAIGVMLGHARVWEHVAQQEAPWSLVMEDDIVEVHPRLQDLLCQLANKEHVEGLGPDWEYLQLQGGPAGTGHEDLQVIGGIGYNAGMYLIRKEAAAKLIKETLPIRSDSQLDDDAGPLQSFLVGYHTSPSAAAQKGSDKDTDVQIFFQVNQQKHRKAEVPKECPRPAAEHMVEPALLQELP